MIPNKWLRSTMLAKPMVPVRGYAEKEGDARQLHPTLRPPSSGKPAKRDEGKLCSMIALNQLGRTCTELQGHRKPGLGYFNSAHPSQIA